MALALNNLKRVDMPLNKETKPNQTNYGSNPNYGSNKSVYKLFTFDSTIWKKKKIKHLETITQKNLWIWSYGIGLKSKSLVTGPRKNVPISTPKTVSSRESSNLILDYLLSFAAGNCQHTSWPRRSLGKLFNHTKFVSRVRYDYLILG